MVPNLHWVFQPVTTTLSVRWANHCPSAPGFQLPSSRLLQIQHEACFASTPILWAGGFLFLRPGPEPTATTIVDFGCSHTTQSSQGSSMPTIPCLCTPELRTSTSRPFSGALPCKPPSMAPSARSRLSLGLQLTIVQSSDRDFYVAC